MTASPQGVLASASSGALAGEKDSLWRIEDAIQITNGRYFVPLDPGNPMNDYDIEYIAHSLSLQCRWMGGTSCLVTGDPMFYSVAQHSVHVADLVNLGRSKLLPEVDWEREPAPTFYGLMHDSSEAYLCDIPRPLKPKLVGYYDFEAKLMSSILGQFGVPVSHAIKEAVRRVDNAMIFWERDKLIGQPVEPYGNEDQHPGTTIEQVIPEFRCWSPAEAKRAFLDKFEEIKRWQGNHVPLQYANRGYGI